MLPISVSNRMGFSCPFIVLGQRDNEASSKSCQGTGWNGILTSCQGMGQDRLGQDFDGLSLDRTQDRRETRVQKNFLTIYEFKKKYFAKQGVILSRDVLGQMTLSQNFCSCYCPGTKGQREVSSLRNPTYYLYKFQFSGPTEEGHCPMFDFQF